MALRIAPPPGAFAFASESLPLRLFLGLTRPRATRMRGRWGSRTSQQLCGEITLSCGLSAPVGQYEVFAEHGREIGWTD